MGASGILALLVMALISAAVALLIGLGFFDLVLWLSSTPGTLS